MTTFIGHSVSDGEGHILTMDESVCEFLHRSVRDMTGLSFVDITHPADVARNLRQIAGLSDERRPLLIRKRYLRPDRTVLHAAVQVSRFSSQTDGTRLFGTIFAESAPSERTEPRRGWAAARRARTGMMARRAAMGDVLFADHGWLLLVEVYLAEAEGRIVTIQDLARQIDLDLKIAWRLLRTMEVAGIVDPVLVNEFAVQLTKAGVMTVERLLATAPPEPFEALQLI